MLYFKEIFKIGLIMPSKISSDQNNSQPKSEQPSTEIFRYENDTFFRVIGGFINKVLLTARFN